MGFLDLKWFLKKGFKHQTGGRKGREEIGEASEGVGGAVEGCYTRRYTRDGSIFGGRASRAKKFLNFGT